MATGIIFPTSKCAQPASLAHHTAQSRGLLPHDICVIKRYGSLSGNSRTERCKEYWKWDTIWVPKWHHRHKSSRPYKQKRCLLGAHREWLVSGFLLTVMLPLLLRLLSHPSSKTSTFLSNLSESLVDQYSSPDGFRPFQANSHMSFHSRQQNCSTKNAMLSPTMAYNVANSAGTK